MPSPSSVAAFAALLTVAGNAAGIYVQVVLVALGSGVIVERSAMAFTVPVLGFRWRVSGSSS